MSVGTGLRLVLALGLAIVATLPANAFQSGEWEGQASTDETGKFSDCTMTAADESGDQDAVPQARDREQLGDALEHADHDRLEVAEHRISSGGGWSGEQERELRAGMATCNDEAAALGFGE